MPLMNPGCCWLPYDSLASSNPSVSALAALFCTYPSAIADWQPMPLWYVDHYGSVITTKFFICDWPWLYRVHQCLLHAFLPSSSSIDYILIFKRCAQ
ncbi:unnamed protein product [Periconia digitata]|uniref:Uncharacterized protein n=1 Tax=Periconia digitata TaxID=1303443 RepID=A0A9W4XG27_9PLEO|nr:unnamed protein product [Periconia digitata]